MIPPEFQSFGLVNTHQGRPHSFRVWSSPYNYVDVPVSCDIIDVRWSGGSITLTSESHIRIYYGLGPSQYEVIYS